MGGMGGMGAMQPMGGGMQGMGGGSSAGLKMGTVKVWFEEKGFGFIAPADGGDDVFCHRKQLEDGQSLVQGASVQFEAEWSAQRNKMAVKRCSGAAAEGGPGGAGGPPALSALSDLGGPPPPNGQMAVGQMMGTVKAWFDDKGFGFLAPAMGGNDVFVGRHALQDGQTLTLGAQVQYNAEWDARKSKYTATQCTGAIARPAGAGGPPMGGGGGGFGSMGGGMGGDNRFSPYGGGAGASGPDPALQRAAMQAQQNLGFGVL
mmetsp:Transcript_15246/g.38364  ORF Transcript_15246/g.38364 Transcript_15246/m.38364 type:complete len:260 (-) Transcript_15246:232-1011(-)